MFSAMRVLQENSPEAHRNFLELTQALETAGLLADHVRLDIHPDSLTLSTRRDQWEFHWGFRFRKNETGAFGEARVFLGKPGDIIRLCWLFGLKDPGFHDVYDAEFNQHSDSVKFRVLTETVRDQTTDQKGLVAAASAMARFFLKLQN